jgi:hypothetical protein
MEKDYGNIKRISASIGGFFGTSYTVEIDIMTGKIMWNTSEGEIFYSESKLILQIDSESTKEFVEAIRKCCVLNWEEKYVDLDILDGTQWNLNIELDNMNIKKSGSNAYPKEWEEFCNIIQRFTGKPFE